TRTAKQSQIARFWYSAAGTFTSGGYWNQIAQGVAQQRGDSLVQDARLFALLNLAQADASFAIWDTKYTYNFWRPVTAIRAAGQQIGTNVGHYVMDHFLTRRGGNDNHGDQAAPQAAGLALFGGASNASGASGGVLGGQQDRGQLAEALAATPIDKDQPSQDTGAADLPAAGASDIRALDQVLA